MTVSDEAPAWQVSQWFNTDQPLSLDALRGKVVMIEAFQMLCPGCVSDGLPLAKRVYDTFSRDDVAVIGMHTVFEHHEAQAPVSLSAFLHEYRIPFPVGIDAAGDTGGLPLTMAAYQMQGTPTLVLIDRQGRRRLQHFGHVPDLRLGAEIMALIAEKATVDDQRTGVPPADTCTADGCAAPQ